MKTRVHLPFKPLSFPAPSTEDQWEMLRSYAKGTIDGWVFGEVGPNGTGRLTSLVGSVVDVEEEDGEVAIDLLEGPTFQAARVVEALYFADRAPQVSPIIMDGMITSLTVLPPEP